MQGQSQGIAEGPPAPLGCWLHWAWLQEAPASKQKTLNISERSSTPPPFISSPPSLSLPCKQQSCSPVPLSMGPAPQDAPAAAEPSQVVPSANSFFFSFFFLSYICIFFLPLFFSTQCLFPCHTPPPAPPLPLSPPQALGWPRGCEVRGGSGGCGGLCIDALIAHGLRLTSLLPGKQSPWLLALLLQRRL